MLMDRGVSMIDVDTLHSMLNYWVAPVQLIMFIMWFFAYVVTVNTSHYTRFPDRVYRWIMILEIIYSFCMGPIRWLPGNAWYKEAAYPTTPGGCKFAVFVDTFYHIGTLYSNTVIVSGVFYQIYFEEKWHLSLQRSANRMLSKLFYMITVTVAGYSVFAGEQHNYVGWCIGDTHSIIMKILTWFLFMVLQVIMLIPTQLVYYQVKKEGRDINVGRGTYLRFVVLMMTQLISLFPVLTIEFMGLTRRAVPSALHWIVVVCMPICSIANYLFLTMRIWPKFCENFGMPNPCAMMEGLEDKVYDEGDEEEKADDISKSSDSTIILSEGSDLSDTTHSDDSQNKEAKSKNCLDQIPFWLHLVLTIVVPFVLLVFVSILMIINTNSTKDIADRIRKDIVLTSRMSDYVHETQKERGATGVYMGAQGGRFRCEIQAQYTLTDVYKTILQVYLDQEFDNVKLVTKTTFLKALILTMSIDDHRQNTFGLKIPKSAGLAYYNEMNMYFVGVLGQVCRESKIGNPIQHLMFSNLAFFSGKEKMGIERAVVSIGFGDNHFAISEFRKFADLVSAINAHNYFFFIYVSDANLAMYEEKMQDPAIVEVTRLESIAQTNDPALLAEIESTYFFDTITVKMGLIRQVEASMATQLAVGSRQTVIDSSNGMAGIVLTLAIVLIVDGLMILGLARTSRHLKRFESNERYRNQSSKIRENIIVHFIHWFQSISFVWQVLAPVIMCAIGLMGISWILMSEQIDEAHVAAETWENMNFQFFISNLIHETQKERGMTGTFLGSDGTKFVTELPAQRETVDMRLGLFKQFMQEYVDYKKITELNEYIILTQAINTISNIRAQVTNFETTNIAVGTALGWYVNMNTQMIILSNKLVRTACGDSIEAALLGYIGFFYMKEKAGNERAVGAGTFPKGFPSASNFNKFVQLVAIQGIGYDYFQYFGDADHLEYLESFRVTKEWRTADLWRGYLLNWDESNAVVMGQIATVVASDWYSNVTAKINMWRDVEAVIVTDLNSFFDQVYVEADNRTLLLVLMLGIVFVVSCIVLYRGFKIILASNAYRMYRVRLDQKRQELHKKMGVMKGSAGADGSTNVTLRNKATI